MTDKKNQHYIPKFYLRHFSYMGNLKQIGLFNIKSNFFHQTAPLKNQGSKDFFYGNDGIIEEGLSMLEGSLATTIKKIINDRDVPKKLNKEHINLLVFVGLTQLRNPVIIQNMKDMFKSVQEKISELDKDFDANQTFPDIDHNSAIKLSLSGLTELTTYIADLNYKLLVNKTKVPFITSDFPIAKYNQFLEERKWNHGKTGHGNTGLQIIIPLNNEISVILYDSLIYKVGSRNTNILEIHKNEDIDQLNTLQLLNCFETVYFNENITEHYIKELAKKTLKYFRPNQMHSSLHFIVMNGKERKANDSDNLIVTGSSDLEIKLKIDGIAIHSIGKKHVLSSTMAQLRPIPYKLMEERERHKKNKMNL